MPPTETQNQQKTQNQQNIWSEPISQPYSALDFASDQMRGVMGLLDIERQRNKGLADQISDLQRELGTVKLKHAGEIIEIERRNQSIIDTKNEKIADLRQEISDLKADNKIKNYEIENGQPRTAIMERVIEGALPFLGAFVQQAQAMPQAQVASLPGLQHSGDGMAQQITHEVEPQLSVNAEPSPEQLNTMNQRAVAQRLLGIAISQLQSHTVNKELILSQFEQITHDFIQQTRSKVENSTWVDLVKTLSAYCLQNNIPTEKLADVIEAVLLKIATGLKGFSIEILARMGSNQLYEMITTMYGAPETPEVGNLVQNVLDVICKRVLNRENVA